jgi:hydroxymethylpyrimidine/phosphomethylpyrimidine kinase
MKTALTIAGTDPSSGAGLQADLKTFKALGVYGLSVPSSMTSQNSRGVTDIHSLSSDVFTTQIDTLLDDILPDAVKTGMLYTREIISVTADKIKQYSLKNLVIDPVTLSSTGVPLIRDDAPEYLKKLLLPLAKVATPNIREATAFTGVQIKNEEDMKRAAQKFRELGPESVIITGGHLENNATDLLFDGRDFFSLQREKVDGEYHGTGCVFSSAVAASLALGYDVHEAAVNANDFVWKAIRSAVSIGKGMKLLDV